MKTARLVLTFLFGIFIFFGGVNHFIKPEMYFPFIPDIFPKEATNFLAGVAEIVLGIGVFIPRYRHPSAVGILVMMCGFLPLHVWDVFREDPAIGSHTAALIRLPIQFLFIIWGWFISKKS